MNKVKLKCWVASREEGKSNASFFFHNPNLVPRLFYLPEPGNEIATTRPQVTGITAGRWRWRQGNIVPVPYLIIFKKSEPRPNRS